MAFRTPLDIRTAAIALLDSRGSGIRTETGEPIMDLVDAFSLTASNLDVFTDYVRAINSVAGWRSIVTNTEFKRRLGIALGISPVSLNVDFARLIGAPGDLPTDVDALMFVDLSNWAASFGRPRKLALSATGVERLFLSAGTPFSLLRGALFRTASNTPIVYETVNDLTAVVPGFDLTNNSFFVDAGIQCQTAGTIGNQVANSITVMSTSIPGVTAVTNQATTANGTDRESDSDLLDALEGVLLAGGTVNSRRGLINLMTRQTGVIDAIVITSGSVLMQRTTAGAIDIYVIGDRLVSQQSDFSILSDGSSVILPLQPVRSVSTVTDLTIPGLVFSSGGGYTFIKDTGTFAGSAQEVSNVTFALAVDGGPAVSDLVQIQWIQNALIRDLQRLVDENPDVNVPGSSVLVKEGLRIDLLFQMIVVTNPLVTQSEAETAVKAALNTFLSAFTFGKMIDFSDALVVAATAKDARGFLVADRIDGFRFGKNGMSLGTSDIRAADNQYFRLFDVNFIAP